MKTIAPRLQTNVAQPPPISDYYDVMILRETIREYEQQIDAMIERNNEHAMIVREWDREYEKQLERECKMKYDDVIRELCLMFLSIHVSSIKIE